MVRKLKSSSVSNNQSDIIKQAQMMQEKMLKVQDELKEKFVEETVAGGQVIVKANGQKEIVSLQISAEIIDDASKEKDPEMLSELVLSAVKGAMKKAEELAEQEMSVVTGGVSIPGLF